MAYIGKSPDGTGVRSRFYYTQTSGGGTSVSGSSDDGTSLTFSDGAYVDVYLNGVLLVAGTDYNTTTANTIAGLAALANGDVVEVVVYDIFTVADTVSALNGGTFSSNVNFSGNIDVDGTTTLDGLTVDGDVTLNDGSPNLRLQDTDVSRFVDIMYGTRVTTFRNTMASGEDMDTVEPSFVFSFKDDGETRTAMNIADDGTTTFTTGDSGTIIHRVGTNVAGVKTSSGDDFCVGTADYPQAIRIKNSNSYVGINQTAPTTPFHVFLSGGDICTVQTGRTDTSNVGMIVFRDGDAQTCGQITSQGSSNTTSYNTSSDHRLKQSVTDMTGAIDRVKAMLPKRFSFINDTTNTMHDGFLAHEAQTVVPQSVIGTHNETREVSNAVLLASGKLYAEDVAEEDWAANKGDGENDLYPSDSTWAASHTAPVYQQIDHSKLVPLLTGALQEAIAKIETLETKVAALEAGE